MPMQVDEIINEAKRRGMDVSQLEPRIRQKYGQTGVPDEMLQMPQSQVQQPNQMDALLKQAMGGGRPPVQDAIFRGLSSLTTGKIEDSGQPDLMSKYLQTILGEQAKSLYREPEFVVSYDQNGQPIFTKAPGNIKNAPFYSTPMGGSYYQAKTGQAESQGRQASVESQLMEKALPSVDAALSGKGGNLPPGTSISVGPVNMPVNPKLSGEEMAAVSASEVFPPLSQGLKEDTRSGIFDSKFGDVGRTYRQFAASQPNALLTSYDPKLQETQGKINSIRRYVFGEGGKQLTPYEAKIVMALITPTGKNNQQYETDLDEAIKIIQSKARLALGGANVANQPQEISNDFSKMSDEELQLIASGQ